MCRACQQRARRCTLSHPSGWCRLQRSCLSISPSLTILVCPLFLRVWGLHAPSPPEAERWAELIETTMENLERERVAASIMSAQLRLAGLAVEVGVRTIFDPSICI